MSSLTWYVGVPGSGKTTAAVAGLARDCQENRRPAIVVDDARVEQFADWERARSLPELLDLVCRRGCSLAWSPAEPGEVEDLARELQRRGNVNLLVDEAATWLSSSRGRGGELLKLMRRHRHAGVAVHLTTQHLSGDVPQEALSCAPRLLVFRCTSPAVLDRLEREYGLDRGLVAGLPRWEYLEVRTGFPDGA